MVFYKPYTDKSEISALFPHTEFSETAVWGAYTALENEQITGKCLVKIMGSACEITALESPAGDPLLTEGLVRSALHFASNRSAYIAECRAAQFRDVLLLLGFSEENGVFKGEIPDLLRGSCCKNS